MYAQNIHISNFFESVVDNNLLLLTFVIKLKWNEI